MSRPLKLLNSLVQLGNARFGELARSRPVIRRVQLEQLLDLNEREARALGLSDEPEPAKILGAVATNSAVTRWLIEQAFALVEADCLDADAAGVSELSDRQAACLLTLYHGTEPM